VADWITDDQLRSSAGRLVGSMIAMLRADGLDPDIVGVPDQEDSDVLAKSIEVDAEQYMSMNPERLAEEYDEIRRAASNTKRLTDPDDVVGSTKTEIEAWWTGTASVAFCDQLTAVESCIDAQHEYTLYAAQAVGMMFAVNVKFRASCVDLMESTADVCDSVARKLGNTGTRWSEVGLHLIGNVIGAIRSPASIADLAITEFLGMIGKAVESKPVDGAEAIPVVAGYNSARDRLFASYEDNLGQIGDWLAGIRSEYSDLATTTIPEPVPRIADVDSPDFRYGNFVYSGHHAADYAPEVERERRKYVDETSKPDGVIAQRLGGS